MVDFLAEQKINILLCIGGDGTLRGEQEIAKEVQKRGLNTAVVAIPKTIDNDAAAGQGGLRSAAPGTRRETEQSKQGERQESVSGSSHKPPKFKNQ